MKYLKKIYFKNCNITPNRFSNIHYKTISQNTNTFTVATLLTTITNKLSIKLNNNRKKNMKKRVTKSQPKQYNKKSF